MADLNADTDQKVDGQEAIAEKAPSLRDMLSTGFDEFEQSSIEPAPDDAAEVERKAQAERDDKGRFAAKGTETQAAKVEPDKAPAATNSATGQAATATEPGSKPAEVAPVSWSQEAKAAWAALPPAIQTAVLKREKEASDGIKQKSDQIRHYEEIETLMAPRRAELAKRGYRSDAQAIKTLLDVSDSIARDAPGTIQRLAQAYGVNLTALASPNPDGQQQQPNFDPNQLIQHARQISAQESQNAFRQFAQQQEQARIESQIKDWAKDKPYYAKVEGVMVGLMQAGVAQRDLNDAYQKAVALDPEIQAEIRTNDEARRATEVAAAEEKRKAAAAALVNKARNASVSVGGSSPSGQAAAPRRNKTVREELLEASGDSGSRL